MKTLRLLIMLSIFSLVTTQFLRAMAPSIVVDKNEALKVNLRQTHGKLPLSFEANKGQTDPQVKFLSRGPGYALFFTAREAVLRINRNKHESAVVRIWLRGANLRAPLCGQDELPGRSNYFIGSDRKHWHMDVPSYSKVRYRGVYPGIDLVYRGNEAQLEYDFAVEPRADPTKIRLRFSGIRDLHVDGNGDLILTTPAGQLREQKPVVYQDIGGARREVSARYRVMRGQQVGFDIAAYDRTRPLIIDPVLVYSTYLGGSGDESQFQGIAVDSQGNAYVIGSTSSTDFPTTNNAIQTTLGGGEDALVTKLNAAGNAIVYSTYLGGSDTDIGSAIAIDQHGNAYVTGTTRSGDFPITPGAIQSTLGLGDAFVAKLNAAGDTIVYSTYLGGSAPDRGFGIAVDEHGNAYVTGDTSSADFPISATAVQPTLLFTSDTFVTKLNTAGDALIYSTYLGGGGMSAGIAVDQHGNAYVVGVTPNPEFPTTPNAVQPTFGFGGGDAFVAKLNSAGAALVYATYLGGDTFDVGTAIAVDQHGNAYVTGFTFGDFPTTPNAVQPTFGGTPATRGFGGDAFVTKLNAAGDAMVYSTYLGGSGADNGEGIVVDQHGNAYVTGVTSGNFTTASAIQSNLGGRFDAFVTKLNAAGDALLYSTYLGGSNFDFGSGIAVDQHGNAYVTGNTSSSNFPTTPNVLDGTLNGVSDAFVTKISDH